MTRSLLPLPMSPAQALGLIREAAALLPPKMDSEPARVQVLAQCLQESSLAYRRQMGDGPARGLAQFERGGGVAGVLHHPLSRDLARGVCEARGVAVNTLAVWTALEFDDVLNMALSRLLLWTDPRKLPDPDEFIDPDHHIDPNDPNASASWRLYYRVWRPGKPHINKWPKNHATALAAVRAEGEA